MIVYFLFLLYNKSKFLIYSLSSYSDNRYKYEWLANGSKTKVGNNIRGIGKVDVYVKDGKVIEISPFNV